jgi:hypothetical protein
MELLALAAGIGLWGWIFGAAFFLIVVAALEFENGSAATVATVAAAVAAYFIGWIDVAWILDNPGVLAGYALGYLGAGAAWCVIKWYFHLLRFRDKARIRLENRKFANDAERNDAKKALYENRPLASENKSLLITWMAYWPFSFVWTIVNDPVRRAFNAIYSHLAGLLQRISDRVFREFA